MIRRSPRKPPVSLIVIVGCAVFAYYARISGLPDVLIALGATVISALVLGYVWRRQAKDDQD